MSVNPLVERVESALPDADRRVGSVLAVPSSTGDVHRIEFTHRGVASSRTVLYLDASGYPSWLIGPDARDVRLLRSLARSRHLPSSETETAFVPNPEYAPLVEAVKRLTPESLAALRGLLTGVVTGSGGDAALVAYEFLVYGSECPPSAFAATLSLLEGVASGTPAEWAVRHLTSTAGGES